MRHCIFDWVSVEEELPPDYYSGDPDEYVTIRKLGSGYHLAIETWYGDKWGYDDHKDGEVLYWLPLPDLPDI